MTIQFGNVKRAFLFGFFTLIVALTSGCHRGEDDYDDRTLAQRPHVETVQPENKKDIFRP